MNLLVTFVVHSVNQGLSTLLPELFLNNCFHLDIVIAQNRVQVLNILSLNFCTLIWSWTMCINLVAIILNTLSAVENNDVSSFAELQIMWLELPSELNVSKWLAISLN